MQCPLENHSAATFWKWNLVLQTFTCRITESFVLHFFFQHCCLLMCTNWVSLHGPLCTNVSRSFFVVWHMLHVAPFPPELCNISPFFLSGSFALPMVVLRERVGTEAREIVALVFTPSLYTCTKREASTYMWELIWYLAVCGYNHIAASCSINIAIWVHVNVVKYTRNYWGLIFVWYWHVVFITTNVNCS